MLADILGQHLQSKHCPVIPQSITLPVAVFIIHALWSYSLRCKRVSKLGWLSFRVELCFISRPKPQVYSSGRCWMLPVMDALHVLINPPCLEWRPSIHSPAAVGARWKRRSEGRVMINQGRNQNPLCTACLVETGHKAGCMDTNHWAELQKSFCPSFPSPSKQGRLSTDPWSTLRTRWRISSQGQGIVGPEPGQCIYHDWLPWAWGEPLLGKALLQQLPGFPLLAHMVPPAIPHLTCPQCLWAAQLSISHKSSHVPRTKIWALGEHDCVQWKSTEIPEGTGNVSYAALLAPHFTTS